jgi:hypothetical protein
LGSGKRLLQSLEPEAQSLSQFEKRRVAASLLGHFRCDTHAPAAA